VRTLGGKGWLRGGGGGGIFLMSFFSFPSEGASEERFRRNFRKTERMWM